MPPFVPACPGQWSYVGLGCGLVEVLEYGEKAVQGLGAHILGKQSVRGYSMCLVLCRVQREEESPRLACWPFVLLDKDWETVRG